MAKPLLSIKGLTVTVGKNENGKVLLDHVDLEIPELGIMALVGGSGSGKTTTGLATLRLLPSGLCVQGGEVMFAGHDLLKASEAHMRSVRGGGISMVFQEPLNAFNPVFSIGYQIDEMLGAHTRLSKGQRRLRSLELLDQVGLPDPKNMAGKYPHQLSGGMRQRAMIAQAIAANPKLIIADEPTSNLDVTLQARIMDLFKRLQRDLDLTILLITHDLGMVGHMADQVAVMDQGKIVERGETRSIMQEPQHPYTRELMEALSL